MPNRQRSGAPGLSAAAGGCPMPWWKPAVIAGAVLLAGVLQFPSKTEEHAYILTIVNDGVNSR